MNKQATISFFALSVLGMATAAPVTSADHRALDKHSEEYFHEIATSSDFALDGLGSMFRDIQKSKRLAPKSHKEPVRHDSKEHGCSKTVHIEVDVYPAPMPPMHVSVSVEIPDIDHIVVPAIEEALAFVPPEVVTEDIAAAMEDIALAVEDIAIVVDTWAPAAPAAAAAP